MKKILYPTFLGIVILLIWQLAVMVLEISEAILPMPINLAKYFCEYLITGDLLTNVGTTVLEIIVGTILGILVGGILGYLLGKLKIINRLFMPILVIVQVAPKISLAPLFILWFGLGISSKVALVILVVSFPILVNVQMMLKEMNSAYLDLLKVFGATKGQQFKTLEFPFILTSIMSGVKIAVTQAMTGAVIGEMMGAKSGLGYLLVYGNEMYDINIILSSVILLSIIGLILFSLAQQVEKRMLFWK